MKIIKIIFLIVFFFSKIYSQTLERTVVSSQGDFFSNTSGSLSWTLGEISIETYSSINNHLTQGFQQPDSLLFTGIKELSLNDHFFIWPNPSNDIINIRSKENEYFDVRVYNVLGSLVFEKKNCFEKSQFSFIDFSNGSYIINIFDKDNLLNKRIKFLKIN